LIAHAHYAGPPKNRVSKIEVSINECRPFHNQTQNVTDNAQTIQVFNPTMQVCLHADNSITSNDTVLKLENFNNQNNKGKAIPLKALTGPEGSRRLRLPDF
jgi:hypothetical protein